MTHDWPKVRIRRSSIINNHQQRFYEGGKKITCKNRMFVSNKSCRFMWIGSLTLSLLFSRSNNHTIMPGIMGVNGFVEMGHTWGNSHLKRSYNHGNECHNVVSMGTMVCFNRGVSLFASSSSSSDNDVDTELDVDSTAADKEDEVEPKESSLRLLPGLSGFACNDDIHGFVALISCRYSNTSSGEKKMIVPIMMTSTDRADRISSPEALCLIQLAAGLDLGTVIFPPDTLKDFITEELMEDDDDDDENELILQSLQYNLMGSLQITQTSPSSTQPKTSSDDTTTDTTDDDVDVADSSTRRRIQDGDEKEFIVTMDDYFEDPEREKRIQTNAKKMLSVIQNLPGLMDITAAHLYQAMSQVADADGNITTRQSFSEMLNLLRQRHLIKQQQDQKQQNQQIRPQDPLIQFTIPIQKIIDPILLSKNFSSPSNSNNENKNNGNAGSNNNNNINQTNCHCNVDIPSPFIAVALSMRYNLQIQIEDSVISKYGIDESELLEKYPTFRSIQEIQQESQDARGFLSSTYNKISRTSTTNQRTSSTKNDEITDDDNNNSNDNNAFQ